MAQRRSLRPLPGTGRHARAHRPHGLRPGRRQILVMGSRSESHQLQHRKLLGGLGRPISRRQTSFPTASPRETSNRRERIHSMAFRPRCTQARRRDEYQGMARSQDQSCDQGGRGRSAAQMSTLVDITKVSLGRSFGLRSSSFHRHARRSSRHRHKRRLLLPKQGMTGPIT